MILRPPRSKRTDTLFPYTTLCRSLCRLADDADGWGENFLAPILRDAGYRVASDKESGDEAPDVLLCLSDDGDACANLGGDAPVIRLRASVAAAGADDATIYRHDRQALLDALRRRDRQTVGEGNGGEGPVDTGG